MESVKVLNWIETNTKSSGSGWSSGDGSGSCWSSGDGSGWGSGDGWGWSSGDGSCWSLDDGSGWGSGDGSGWGSGDGWGWSSGDGSGWGSGDGSGWGSGDGWGDGSDISSLNGEQIFYIDGVPTIFKRIIGNLAKGFIVNLRGFTKSACYIVKGDGYFAHGSTAKEAQDALLEKILEDKSEEERIEEFIARFPKGKKAPGTEYYEWHHILTGSCKFGRDEFVRLNHINLNSKYTPEEFIEIVKNAYGSDVIKQLKREYEKGGEK